MFSTVHVYFNTTRPSTSFCDTFFAWFQAIYFQVVFIVHYPNDLLIRYPWIYMCFNTLTNVFNMRLFHSQIHVCISKLPVTVIPPIYNWRLLQGTLCLRLYFMKVNEWCSPCEKFYQFINTCFFFSFPMASENYVLSSVILNILFKKHEQCKPFMENQEIWTKIDNSIFFPHNN